MTQGRAKKVPTREDYSEEYFLINWKGYKESLRGEVSLRHKNALEYLDVHPGDMILDIGCARGEFIKLCGERGGTVIGIDYSTAAVNLSNNWKDANVTVIQASATALPFREGIFDKVVMLYLVEHLAPDDAMTCLVDVKRVLKDKGEVLIHTPNQWGEMASQVIIRLFKPILSLIRSNTNLISNDYYSLHVNVPDPISLRRTLHNAGFKCKIWFAKHPLQDAPFTWLLMDRILFFLTTIWCRAYKA